MLRETAPESASMAACMRVVRLKIQKPRQLERDPGFRVWLCEILLLVLVTQIEHGFIIRTIGDGEWGGGDRTASEMFAAAGGDDPICQYEI